MSVLTSAALLWSFLPIALAPGLQLCDTLHNVLAGANAGALLYC